MADSFQEQDEKSDLKKEIDHEVGPIEMFEIKNNIIGKEECIKKPESRAFDSLRLCTKGTDNLSQSEKVNTPKKCSIIYSFNGYNHDENFNVYVKEEDEQNKNLFQEDSESANSVTNEESGPTDIEMYFKDAGSHEGKVIKINVNDENKEGMDPVEHRPEKITVDCSKFLDKMSNIKYTIGEEILSLEDLLPKNSDKIEEIEEKIANEEIEDLLSQKFIKVRTDILVYHGESAGHPLVIEEIPWNWLNEEKWRLHTFSRYPHSANKSAILLAQAGFAYIGSGKSSDDKVICFSCCVVKENWRITDVIDQVHKDMSPNCSMVTGINCTNVPMVFPLRGSSLFGQLQNSTELLANEDRRPKAGSAPEEDAIETDSDHPHGLDGGQRQQRLSTSARTITPAHDARHFQMANQTVSKPSTSLSSASVHLAETSSTQPQQPNSASQSNAANPSVADLASNNPPADGTLAFENNTSSTRPAVQQTATQISTQISTSSASIAPQQTSQIGVSSSQNISTVTVSSAPINSLTNTTSTTTSTTLNRNQVTDPQQGQNTTLRTTTGETQNVRPAGRTPTYAELGIITERPKRYEYAVRAKRWDSFEPWPRDHHLRKEDLADAGFYYAGYGDCARCFYCGGGLRNWEDNDNVWVEHARWFPKCAFIRQAMGQEFVDTVQELNKSNDQITFKMVTDKMGSSAATFQLDTKNMPLKRDPAVMTVLGMGYTEKDVFEAADYVKENSGFLSADKLYEKLVQDGKQRQKIETPPDSQAVSSNTNMSKDEAVMNQLREQNSQLRQQTVCKICMDKEVAVVFLPCGHFVSCTDCASALKDCPVCRNPVRGIVRAFMA